MHYFYLIVIILLISATSAKAELLVPSASTSHQVSDGELVVTHASSYYNLCESTHDELSKRVINASNSGNEVIFLARSDQKNLWFTPLLHTQVFDSALGEHEFKFDEVEKDEITITAIGGYGNDCQRRTLKHLISNFCQSSNPILGTIRIQVPMDSVFFNESYFGLLALEKEDVPNLGPAQGPTLEQVYRRTNRDYIIKHFLGNVNGTESIWPTLGSEKSIDSEGVKIITSGMRPGLYGFACNKLRIQEFVDGVRVLEYRHGIVEEELSKTVEIYYSVSGKESTTSLNYGCPNGPKWSPNY